LPIVQANRGYPNSTAINVPRAHNNKEEEKERVIKNDPFLE